MSIAATPTNGSATFPSNANDVYGIIEKVGLQIFRAAPIRNKLSVFDHGILNPGEIIEDVVFKAAESRAYERSTSSAVTPVSPKTAVRYFSGWIKRNYQATIYDSDVQAVLSGAKTIGDIVSAQLATLDAGERADDYVDTLKTITDFTATFARDSQKITLGEQTFEDLATTIRTLVDGFTFNNSEYAGIDDLVTSSEDSGVVVLVPYKVFNKMDVTYLAKIINPNYANIIPTVIKTDATDGHIVVADRDAFQVWTKVRYFNSQENINIWGRDYILGVEKAFFYNPLYKAATIDVTGLE